MELAPSNSVGRDGHVHRGHILFHIQGQLGLQRLFGITNNQCHHNLNLSTWKFKCQHVI